MNYQKTVKILNKLHLKHSFREVVSALHIHHQSNLPNIIIFSTPRSGSTLLLDIIALSPKIKGINEPLHNRGMAKDSSKYIDNLRWRYVNLTSEEKEGFKKYFNYLMCCRMSNYPVNTAQHHWLTNRCAIKCLRAPGQEKWFLNNFNFQALYLIRHPISSSLSRIRNGWAVGRKKQIYHKFFSSKIFQEFTHAEILKAFVEKKIDTGTQLEIQVILWCFENMTVLKNLKRLNGLTLLTYEELVLKGETVINFLVDDLELSNSDAMKKLLNKPSNSSRYSRKETNAAIKKNEKQYLLEKWRHKVNESDLESVKNILNLFDIDIYSVDSIKPNPFYTKFLNSGSESKS